MNAEQRKNLHQYLMNDIRGCGNEPLHLIRSKNSSQAFYMYLEVYEARLKLMYIYDWRQNADFGASLELRLYALRWHRSLQLLLWFGIYRFWAEFLMKRRTFCSTHLLYQLRMKFWYANY